MPVFFKKYKPTYYPNKFMPATLSGFAVDNVEGTAAERSVTGTWDMSSGEYLTWFKNVDAVANNQLYDTVRLATNYISSNSTAAQATLAQGLKSFDSEGYTVGTDSAVNGSSNTISTWRWRSGSAYGFDIVTGTKGAGSESFSHSLTVKPELIIAKDLDAVSQVWVCHKSMGASMHDYYAFLNLDSATASGANAWGDEPTSSLVYLTESQVDSGHDFVIYLFASISNLSSVGSYTGDGNASQSITTPDFQPDGLIIKNNDASGNWFMWDSGSGDDFYFQANSNGTGSAADVLDFTASGFDVKSAALNGSGTEYLYACWKAS